MNLKILGFVGLLSAAFIAAVIWKMDSFIVSDRGSWAQAQMRTQVTSMQQSIDGGIKNLYRLSFHFLEPKKDKNFWSAIDPIRGMAWIRDLKNPTVENVSYKEGSGLDDAAMVSAVKEIQNLKPANQKLQFVPWKDARKKKWILIVWPWGESRHLVLWAGPEFVQGSIENFKGTLSQMMLVNENGQILAHDESEYFASRADDHPLFLQHRDQGLSQGGSSYQDKKNQKFLGHIAAVPRSNLLVMAQASQHSLLADKNKIWASFLLLGLGLVLVTLAGLVFFNRNAKVESVADEPVVTPKANVGALPVTVVPPAVDEKHMAYKKIASSLGHELRGPMINILGFCQMILSKEKDAEIKTHVDSILREARTARELLDKLFSFAQEKDAPTEKVRVAVLLQNVLARVQPTLTRKNIILKKDILSDSELNLSGAAVEKAIEAVFQNSIEALERKVKKEIKVKLQSHDKGAELTIEDNGEGIETEDLAKVFDPFFTTRSYAHHLGLGLSAAYGVFKQFGGDIKVESQRGQGTKLILYFPVAEVTKKKEVPSLPASEKPMSSDVVSFSPADVEIEKLMDLAENEMAAPAPAAAPSPQVEDKTVVVSASDVPVMVPDTGVQSSASRAQLDKAHIFVEKPKSALDEIQVHIRRPRQIQAEGHE